MRAEMASEKNGRFIPLDVSKVSTYILCLSTCCYNRLLVYLFPLLRIYYYLAVLLFFFARHLLELPRIPSCTITHSSPCRCPKCI